MIAADHRSSTNNGKMPSKKHSRQPVYEADGSSRSDENKSMPSIMTKDSHDRFRGQRVAAVKQVSKRSISSESSGSKVSGMTGFETEFDLDKHRNYDVARSRQRYEECEPTRASSTLEDDNLTDEQRAWAGIDAILDDDVSIGEDDVLPEGIREALQHSQKRGGDDYGDDEEDSDEDSHDHAMKMFCGYSAGEDGGDLPTLMDSSFTSQFSQESARSVANSVFSYLSKNNIIVQRDIHDGPLKNFLSEMAFNVEQTEAVNEEDEENDQKIVNDDDDETEIELLEEGASPKKRESEAAKDKDEDDTSTSLDPIGQQIINAIMTEMKRMKESDEYDEDDHVDDDDDDDDDDAYDEDEYDEERVEDDDGEYYDDGEYGEYEGENGVKESAPVSPRQSHP